MTEGSGLDPRQVGNHEIFSTAILSLPGLLEYIEVNFFSTFRTFDDTYLLYSFTQKKRLDILLTPPDEGGHLMAILEFFVFSLSLSLE